MGVSGQRHAPAALLPPGKGPPVPIVQEGGWAPEPVWIQRIEEKSFAPAGDRTPIARSSASSQTLYCLSQPGSVEVLSSFIKKTVTDVQYRIVCSLTTRKLHSYKTQSLLKQNSANNSLQSRPTTRPNACHTTSFSASPGFTA
jgi:hypothetical protein